MRAGPQPPAPDVPVEIHKASQEVGPRGHPRKSRFSPKQETVELCWRFPLWGSALFRWLKGAECPENRGPQGVCPHSRLIEKTTPGLTKPLRGGDCASFSAPDRNPIVAHICDLPPPQERDLVLSLWPAQSLQGPVTAFLSELQSGMLFRLMGKTRKRGEQWFPIAPLSFHLP